MNLNLELNFFMVDLIKNYTNNNLNALNQVQGQINQYFKDNVVEEKEKLLFLFFLVRNVTAIQSLDNIREIDDVKKVLSDLENILCKIDIFKDDFDTDSFISFLDIFYLNKISYKEELYKTIKNNILKFKFIYNNQIKNCLASELLRVIAENSLITQFSNELDILKNIIKESKEKEVYFFLPV